ncbi:unnamed protein product, partial [Mesorhabditis spiculigera]
MSHSGPSLVLLVIAWVPLALSQGQSAGIQEQLILNNLLANYDMRVRPPPTNASDPNGPVVVRVNILIRMLSKIDVVNMEYSMQITFREEWMDRRLAYAHLGYQNAPKFLTVPHVKDNLWIPDSFFPTEKAAHRHLIDTENMFLRIHADGTILYSVRLSLTLSCSMNLQLYPLDTQQCNFDLISYAHTTKDIDYEWDKRVPQPVQKKPGVGDDLPNFMLMDPININNDCTSHTNTGSYACLRMELRLKRQFSYYFLQLYFPTSMIVAVSWVSFWIDMHSTAGRVALGVTTLLTMTTMQSAINAKLPPVSYVKLVDAWLGACQMFVFGALMEYAVVSYQDSSRQAERKRIQAIRKNQKRGREIENPGYQPPCTCHLIADSEPQPLRARIRKWFTKPDYFPAKIDYYCRFWVPVGFLGFMACYWAICTYLTANATTNG